MSARPALHTVGPPSAPLRVCLVEDSTLLLRTLSETLHELGAVELVATAQREDTAVRLLRSAPDAFDLLVLDIFLASGSGLGVLRAAKVLQPQARVVVLTNYATLDVRKSCIGLGADRVFDKTRQIDDFVAYCGDVAAAHAGHAPERDDGPATVPVD